MTRSVSSLWIGAALALMYGGAVFYAIRLFAPCDDTYIYLVYVRNLLEGNGLTFNGAKVQGFTSSLWTAFIAAGGLLPASLPVVADRLSMASGLFAMVMTFVLGRRQGLAPALALLPVLLLVTTGDFAFYMSNGIETVFYTGMLLWTLSFAFSEQPQRTLRSNKLPLVLAATILARPEGGLAVVAVIGYLAWRGRTHAWLRPALIIAAVVLPVLIAAKVYYGSFLPNTYYAKATHGFVNARQGLIYLKFFIRHKAIVVLALAFIARWRWKQLGDGGRFLLLFLAAYVAYVVYQGGDNLVGHRALLPVLPVMYILVVSAFSALRRWQLVAAVVVIASLHVANYNFGRVIGSSWVRLVNGHAEQWRYQYSVRRDLADYLVENYPPNTLIAVNAAGIIPYYTRMPAIDMLGLNDVHIAHKGKSDRTLAYGHQRGDGDYVLKRRPQVILLGGFGLFENVRFVSDKEMWRHPLFRRFYRAAEFPHGTRAYVRIDPAQQRQR